MAWRNCNASVALVNEINFFWPKRDKGSDGTIGDAAHATRTSDHNPWITVAGQGVVRARDIDKDGIDAAWLAEELRKRGAAGDRRLTGGGYVIFNRRITSPDFKSWKAYTGTNPHTAHVHVSFSQNQAGFDDGGPWNLLGTPAKPAAPATKFPIVGAVGECYKRTGGKVGTPDGPEVPTLDGKGRWQGFSGGAIYWHPDVDNGVAHEVRGIILERWRKIGSEITTGYPTTDELQHDDKRGASSHFANAHAIYWTPQTGAWEIRGGFLSAYAAQGWEKGPLGYPTSAEYDKDGITTQNFEKGQQIVFDGKVFRSV